MMKRLIKLTEKLVTFSSDRPIDLGAKIDLEIRLPEGTSIKSFVLQGVVSDCALVQEKASRHYLVDMKIGDLSPFNQKILTAFMEFAKRESIIRAVSIDADHLQETLTDLKRKFTRLAAAVEMLKINAQGALELIKRDASGKNTLH